MFDIGFFELTLIGVVLLVVMGPERLPEVARQIAFVVRKVRGWVYNMKAEMNLSDDPIMQELKQAKMELSDFERDLKQMGQDFAQEAESLDKMVNLDGKSDQDALENRLSDEELGEHISEPASEPKNESVNEPLNEQQAEVMPMKASQSRARKKVSKKAVAKKATKKVSKKATKKASKKTKATANTTAKKTVAKKVAKKKSKKVAKKPKAKTATTQLDSANQPK